MGGEDGVGPSKSYFPGIFQAMLWAATALVSQVQQLPGHWLARIIGLFWMFAVLRAADANRQPELVPLRYGRMPEVTRFYGQDYPG